MRFIWLIVATLGLLAWVVLMAALAQAQGVPAGATPLITDGLGAGGQAFQWSWLKSKTDPTAPAMSHIFLQTGSNPEPYGHVTVNLDPAMFPLLSTGGYPKPLCSGGMGWTDSSYTPPGYSNPEPIGIVVSTGEYSAPGPGNTIDVWWANGNFLPPRTAYSIIVTCGSKVGNPLVAH